MGSDCLPLPSAMKSERKMSPPVQNGVAGKTQLGLVLGVFHVIALAILIAYVMFPMVWLVVSTFKERVELFSKPPTLLPRTLQLREYVNLLHDPSFTLSVRNSLIVASATTLCTLAVGSLGAYAFARMQFPGRRQLYLTILATQMLPSITLVIPLFMLLRKLGLLYTFQGVILSYMAFTLPYVVWLLRAFFLSIPASIEEAARVDGCSRLSAIMKVVFPLSAPGLAATGIYAFVGAWNEFIFASIITNMATKTFPVRVAEFVGDRTIVYEAMFPAAVLGSLPVVLLVLVFQRQVIQGLTEGGVKF